MGFGKKTDISAPEKTTGPTIPEFRPTTKKELKAIMARARARDAAKKEPKLHTRDPVPIPKDILVKRPKLFLKKYAELVDENRKIFLTDKKNDARWAPAVPRYELFELPKFADSNFINEVIGSILNLKWKQLRILYKAATGKSAVGKEYMQTQSLVRRVMYHVLGVIVDKKGVRYQLADRDATLEIWPAKPLESRVVSKSSIKASNKKLKKSVVEDEDEDELEEVDEAPLPKKGLKKKKTKEKARAAAEKTSKSSTDEKVSSSTVLVKGKPREGGGPKAKLLSLIPKSGISVKDLIAKAEVEGYDTAKYKNWIAIMTKNGFIKLK